jgi:hypothetical protein
MLPEFSLPFHGLIAQMATHRNEGISGIEVLPKNVKICITCGPKFFPTAALLIPMVRVQSKRIRLC